MVSRQGHLMWNATFRLLTASLLQAMGLIGCGTVYIMVVCCMVCAFRSGYCFHVPWFPQAFAGFSRVVCSDVFLLQASSYRYTLPVFRLRYPCLCYLAWVLCKLPLSLSLCTNGFLRQRVWFRSTAACVRFRWHDLKPRNSECVRVVYPCRVLSFFLAWVVLFPRCRLCRICMVCCRLHHLACLDQRGLLVWPAEILMWCRI